MQAWAGPRRRACRIWLHVQVGFEYALCPDYGWGLVATRRIEPYEVVLREEPLVDVGNPDEDLAARYAAAAAGTHLESTHATRTK
ncbi:hypothetical protein M885DRAFT_562402 [Pelagophyceae sp. CCMP2097]|nr:hypothetical protein M885DRAFT_562402 [Pelagophyceae sp. CCMP2097]